MKKIILFLFITFFSLPVFAKEFNMNSLTSATLNGTKKRYRATEIYNTGTSGTYTFGTKYNGRISDIETYFEYPVVSGLTYRLTYNMATDDFRNNFGSSYWWDCAHEMTNSNATVFQPTYISYKKVQFSFTPTEDTTCIRVWLRSKNLSSTAITGISNWTLSSITIYDPDFQDTPTPTPTPTSTPSSATNQDIINNQNQNTQDIINNQNQNTQDIINNQNQNTQDIIDNNNSNSQQQIDSQKVCDNFNYQNAVVNGYLNFSGNVVVSSSSTKTSDYISVNSSSEITFIGGSNEVLCFYNNSKVKLSCNLISDYISSNTSVIPVPSGSYYVRFTFRSSSDSVKYNICKNGNQSMNDTITDDNIDDKTSFFTDFEDNDFGLSSIITIPLSTIQQLTNTSCVALTVPIPFTNSNITLPCMTEIYQNAVPTIFNIWQVVSFGIISYFICIDIFKMVKGFKDPNEDKVEVLDL